MELLEVDPFEVVLLPESGVPDPELVPVVVAPDDPELVVVEPVEPLLAVLESDAPDPDVGVVEPEPVPLVEAPEDSELVVIEPVEPLLVVLVPDVADPEEVVVDPELAPLLVVPEASELVVVEAVEPLVDVLVPDVPDSDVGLEGLELAGAVSFDVLLADAAREEAVAFACMMVTVDRPLVLTAVVVRPASAPLATWAATSNSALAAGFLGARLRASEMILLKYAVLRSATAFALVV